MAGKGIPYTVGELRLAAAQPLDPYHRALMMWAAAEIERVRLRYLRNLILIAIGALVGVFADLLRICQ